MNYFAKLTISLLSTSWLIPQSWKTTSARTTSIVVFDLKAALWSCARHQWNNFIVKHCVVRIHADREIVFVHYSRWSTRLIHDCYVKCKLRYGQYSKLRLHSASWFRDYPQQPILRERLFVMIKVILIPVSFMAFFCVCFRVSQGSKGKGKKWAK